MTHERTYNGVISDPSPYIIMEVIVGPNTLTLNYNGGYYRPQQNLQRWLAGRRYGSFERCSCQETRDVKISKVARELDQ